MKTTIERLKQKHDTMLNLCLQGYSNKEISDLVNLKQTQVSIVVRSPNFQHQLALKRAQLDERTITNLATVREEVNQVLKEGSINAARKLCGLVDSEDESIARMSASDLLDRTGHPKVTKSENRSLQAVVVLNPDDVSRIQESVELDSD